MADSALNSSGASNVTITVEIMNIKCNDLPSVKWYKGRGKHYVRLLVDEVPVATTISTRGHLTSSWTGSFHFDTLDSASLELQVYGKHKIRHDKFVGSVKDTISTLLAEGATGAVTRKLGKYDEGRRITIQPAITFTIASHDPSPKTVENSMEEAVTRARNTVEEMRAAPLPVQCAPSMEGVSAPVDNIVTVWIPLLDKIQLFTNIVDKIAEIHPYAKMAWSILSAAQKIVLAQNDRDKSVNGLLEKMNDIYSFVHEAKPLAKIESCKQAVTLMAQQTTECAYFIHDYARNKNFWKRTLKNLASDVDDKIRLYQEAFDKLQSAFLGRSTIRTEITVLRIWDSVEDLAAENDLNDMPYAKGAWYDPGKGCLPGTREKIIDEICTWGQSTDDNIPRIFLLSGVAGSGKSTIAHTVAHRFEQLKRLGSSFCFDRAFLAERHPNNLFSTIARDLADLDLQWKKSLSQEIQGKRGLRNTRAAAVQFNNFILKPSADLVTVGPIVIVIDALDESGDPATRKDLLPILATEVVRLPANFRILITTRAEQDIQTAFDNKDVILRHMEDLDANDDLSQFIEMQLGDVADLERSWPHGAWNPLLVQKAEGLFQWAFTACRFVKQGASGEEIFLNPSKRLEMLLSLTPDGSKLDSLDRLYLEILSRVVPVKEDTNMAHFEAVLGRILAVKEPLSTSALCALHSPGDDDSVDTVGLITRLGSLLSGVGQMDSPVRPLHTSFRDFLTDPKRSRHFYVNTSLQDWKLASASLRVMKSGLRFNICDLETSHIRNVDVPNLNERVKKEISSHLSYSCRFWADHLQRAAFDIGILEDVKDFMHNRFLYWLEALSLLKEVQIAPEAMRAAGKWCKAHDEQLVAFTKDGIKFITTFGIAISHSAPHIYLSALPFAPAESIISTIFLPRFPRTISHDVGKITQWPSLRYIIERHATVNGVLFVSFSPNGKHLATGSRDGVIHIWDSETGDIVAGPFELQRVHICSITFSQDGKYIISGYEDDRVLVWDVGTGAVVAGPIMGPSGRIDFMVISRDGQRICSGSRSDYEDHRAIWVWDAATGNIIAGPFKIREAIICVALSPDARWVAVSSWYIDTIRVWDTEAAELRHFKGSTSSATSLAFSPNSEHIVSGSRDGTIRVWDMRTGTVVAGPLRGHTNEVTCVVFSQDGDLVVSSSSDGTILVWNVETGNTAAEPFQGDSSKVTSVALSQDNKLIASASWDGTVWLWDAEIDRRNQSPAADDSDDRGRDRNTYSADRLSGTDDMTVKGLWEGSADGDSFFDATGHSGSEGGQSEGTGKRDAGTDLIHKLSHLVCVAFSPSGMHCVSGSDDGTVSVWDVKTGSPIFGPLKGHSSLFGVAFSPDGRYFASSSRGRTILIWHAKTGKVVQELPIKDQNRMFHISYIAFSGNSKRIAVGTIQGASLYIQVWDIENGVFINSLPENEPVGFSPDGRQIVAGSTSSLISIYDVETGRVARELTMRDEDHDGLLLSVVFSPSGAQILSCRSNRILVCDAQSGDVILNKKLFDGLGSGIGSATFSYDCRWMVTGSSDGSVRVWDTQTGSIVLGPLYGHTRETMWVGFSLDANFIVSGAEDNIIRVWDVQDVTSRILDGPELLGRWFDGTKLENGWVSKGEELLVWVPPWSRKGFCWPRNISVFGMDVDQTRLDFDRFVHGTSWQRCCEVL